jgi:hypothetical protein
MHAGTQHPHTPSRHTIGRLAYRWSLGRPLDGRPRTDASFLHPGTRALTLTGRAMPWSYWPQWRMSLYRNGGVLAATLGTVGTIEHPYVTAGVAATSSAAAATYAARRAARKIRGWKRNRDVIKPLISALAGALEMTPDEIAGRLVVPADPTGSARIPLPDHFTGKDGQVRDIVRVFGQRIGGEWDSTLNLKARPFYLALSPKPAPPMSARLADVRAAIESTTQARPIMGLGSRGEIVYMDFATEQSHLSLSFGTGAGKSSFLRFLLAQFAYHGVRDFLVCDVKMVSLAGMEAVPGVRIVRDVEEIWDAIAMVRAEMDNRYRTLLANPDATFPRKIVILEEQNAFSLESTLRWRELAAQTGDKRKRPPVWDDISLLLLKARQVNVSLVSVFQRMTAEASGGAGGTAGGVNRDQYALKLLAKHGPSSWDALTGIKPRVLPSAIPGRAVAVLGGTVRHVQLPLVSLAEAIELATSGPTAELVSSSETDHPVPAPRPAVSSPTTQPPAEGVTLRDAVAAGTVPGTLVALAKRIERDPAAPAPIGRRRNAHVYDPAELVAWAATPPTASTPVPVDADGRLLQG